MERLRMTQTRYDLAAATLQQMGLWQEETKRFFAPAGGAAHTEGGRYARISRRTGIPEHGGRGAASAGPHPSTEELKILLCIYRYLGLAPEVISI